MARPCPTLLALALSTLFLLPGALAAMSEQTGELQIPPDPEGQPEGLVGPAAVYFDGASYIFGGRFRENKAFSDAVYRYDHATGTTTRVATLPPVTNAVNPGRYEGGAALVETPGGPRIYYFGGAAQIPVVLRPGEEPVPVPTSIRDIVEFDPTTNRISKLPEQLPFSMWGMGAAAYGSTIYLFGGLSFNIPANEFGRHAEIVAFSPTGALGGRPLVRTLASELPFKVQGSSASLLGNRIYLFGGFADHTESSDANVCPKGRFYNQTRGEYQETQPIACETDGVVAFNPDNERSLGVTSRLPYRMQWPGSAPVKGKAYVFGGNLPNGVASTTIVEFDPARVASPTRVMTPTLPHGIIAAGVASDGDVIHVFAGRGSHPLSGNANVVVVDPRPTPPWAPRSPAVAKETTSVRVTWEPPAYDGELPVTAYRVYRLVDGEPVVLDARTRLTETTALTYTDSTLAPNTAYVYYITAVNNARPSGEGKPARVSLTSEPVPPGRVASFLAQAGRGEVLLQWSPPESDGGANLTGYRIYLNQSNVPYKSFGPSVHEFRDAPVANGVTYRYQVAAVNVKGEGTLSEVEFVTPAEVPPPPTLTRVADEGTGVRLVWAPPEGSVTGFLVLRGLDPHQLEVLQTVSNDATAYVDATAQEGRTYYYAIAAQNAAGPGLRSNVESLSLVSKPSPPRNLLAAPGAGEVRLTWQTPTDTGKADPSTLTYSVSRDGVIVATDIRGATYVDKGLFPGRNYTYSVTAYNPLPSDESESVRAAARPIVNKAPTAVVAVLGTIALPGDPVEMDGSQSTDEDGTVTRYVFDFGDGSPVSESSTSSVTHAYTKNGTYTVTLTVYDNRNEPSAPATASILVGEVTPLDKPEDNDLPPTTPIEPPGGTPKIPGPELLLTLALLGVAALALRGPRRPPVE